MTFGLKMCINSVFTLSILILFCVSQVYSKGFLRSGQTSISANVLLQMNVKRQPIKSSDNVPALKFLIVSSLGPDTMKHYLSSMKSYIATNVKFILNCHSLKDEVCDQMDVITHETGLDSMIMDRSRVKGSKALFYKEVVLPEKVEGFDYVWLLDGDMVFDLHRYDTAKLISMTRQLNASISHPMIKNGAFETSETSRAVEGKGEGAVVSCSISPHAAVYTATAYKLVYKYRFSSTKYNQKDQLRESFVCDLLAKYSSENIPCVTITQLPMETLAVVNNPQQGDNISEISQELQFSNICSEWTQKHVNISEIIRKNLLKQPQYHLQMKDDIQQGTHPSLLDWKQRTAVLYDLHRSQNLSTVLQLAATWDDKTLYRQPIDPFTLWNELSKVVDITDNSLLSTTQYFHALQLFLAMKQDNVTSKELLFLGLFHDIGKVLLLFGEKMENVVCSTFVIKQPGKGERCYPDGKYWSYEGNNNRLISSWNHDAFGSRKLREYAGEKIAWVVLHHSLSPMLRGELECELSEIERTEYLPLLRQLWRYDHMYKNIMTIPVVTEELLEEVKEVIYSVLPKSIVV